MRTRLLAPAVLAVAVAGCSGLGSNADPRSVDGGLIGPTHFREVCVSARFSDEFTLGVATAENSSSDELTLLDAELTDADGIELLGTDVVRPGNLMDSFGVWNGYPPMQLASAPDNERLWRSRTPIADELVEPGERINFILRLRGEGTSGPIEVTYETADGEEAIWASNVRYRIRWRC